MVGRENIQQLSLNSVRDVKPKEKINSLNFKYLFDKDLDSVIKIEQLEYRIQKMKQKT